MKNIIYNYLGTSRELECKILKIAENEDYLTILVKKTEGVEAGNYVVLTRNHGDKIYYKSRSFRACEYEKAEKWFNRLAA